MYTTEIKVCWWQAFHTKTENRIKKVIFFAFFGSNWADNPNIFCNFAPILELEQHRRCASLANSTCHFAKYLFFFLAYVHFLLYLRTSACFAFPRSYVRSVQPILQFARKFIRKIGFALLYRFSFSLSWASSHSAMKSVQIDLKSIIFL